MCLLSSLTLERLTSICWGYSCFIYGQTEPCGAPRMCSKISSELCLSLSTHLVCYLETPRVSFEMLGRLQSRAGSGCKGSSPQRDTGGDNALSSVFFRYARLIAGNYCFSAFPECTDWPGPLLNLIRVSAGKLLLLSMSLLTIHA